MATRPVTPEDLMPKDQGMNFDPATVGWLLSVLGGAAAPQKPGVQALSTGGVAMAKGLQAAKMYKQQQDTQQSFNKLIQQLLAGGVTAKGTPGLDAISAGEDGSLTVKIPPTDRMMDGWMKGPDQTTQVQPGFLSRLFQ